MSLQLLERIHLHNAGLGETSYHVEGKYPPAGGIIFQVGASSLYSLRVSVSPTVDSIKDWLNRQ